MNESSATGESFSFGIPFPVWSFALVYGQITPKTVAFEQQIKGEPGPAV